VYTVEFAALGAVAGFAGGALGCAFATLVASVIFFRFVPAGHLAAPLAGAAGAAAITAVAGWSASFRLLALRPLEILREE
jgi:putative ABC transport system permease protein